MNNKALKQKAKSGDMQAQFELGNVFFFSYLAKAHGVKRGTQQAAYWYDLAAQQGHPGALCQLGYMRGSGEFGYDCPAATDLFARAATKGDVTAMWNLGKMLGEGRGVPLMPDIAEEWFVEAATTGKGNDKYDLGFIYQYGMFGLQKNPIKMLHWYHESADQDDIDALRVLAKMYAEGGFVKENLVLAVEFSDKADSIEGIPYEEIS